jgi:hypothetical protein
MLVLLLASPALRADDKPKDEPKSLKMQYAALEKEFSTKQREIIAEIQKTKGEEQQKLIQKYYGLGSEFADKFYKLAEDNPKDPIAVEALFWVLQNAGKSPAYQKAADKVTVLVADMPLKDLVRRVNAVRGPVAFFDAAFKRAEKDAKEPDAGGVLAGIAVNASYLPVGQKATKLLIEKFPNHPAIEQVCMTLSRSRDPKAVDTLKTVLENSSQQRVKAAAALGLAKALAAQVDQQGDNLAQADKLAAEAEKYLVMVIDTLGKGSPNHVKDAERELKVLRFIRVGKEAPNISAVDLDQKEFKLSDYRGKVVLLDFWGNW